MIVFRHKFSHGGVTAVGAAAAADRSIGKETDGGDPGIFLQRRRQILFDLVKDGGVGGAGEVAGITFVDSAPFVKSEKFRPVFETLVPDVQKAVVVVGTGPGGNTAQTAAEVENGVRRSHSFAEALESADSVRGGRRVAVSGKSDLRIKGVPDTMGAREEEFGVEIFPGKVDNTEEGPATVGHFGNVSPGSVHTREKKVLPLAEHAELPFVKVVYA